jgi:hypothetical protein
VFPPIYRLVAADAACKAVLGDPPRCYFGQAKEGASRPYLVWHMVGGNPENLLDETPPHDHVAGQVDIVADDHRSAKRTRARRQRYVIQPRGSEHRDGSSRVLLRR